MRCMLAANIVVSAGRGGDGYSLCSDGMVDVVLNEDGEACGRDCGGCCDGRR